MTTRQIKQVSNFRKLGSTSVLHIRVMNVVSADHLASSISDALDFRMLDNLLIGESMKMAVDELF